VTTITLPNGYAPREIGQRDMMRYFDGGGKRGVYVWPRRFGKDLSMLHQTIKMAHERVGTYYHILPNHKQARKVLWDAIDNDGRRIMATAIPKEIRASTNETEMKVMLKCGSIWQLVGGDYYDTLMGSNPVGLVFSEAAITDPRAWSFFRPILAANGGWAAFISTPRGYNWFWDILQLAKADPSWDWSHLTSYDTKHITQDALAAEQREMPDELYRQEYLCDFSAANIGAIFGRWIEQAEKEGRIGAIEPWADGEIWVSSDIGFRDKAAFWWWRVERGGFSLIDYDEASGLDAEEWIDRLKKNHPRPRKLLLPHDAKARTFQSRHTVIEQFLNGDVADEVQVNPQRKKADSIAAGRKVLARCRFDAFKCQDGLAALREYHFAYNAEQRIFSNDPEHDWSSHAADAYMEGAAMLSDYVSPPDRKKVIVPPMNHAFSLEQLWELAPNQKQGRI
jgi:phage terminase large subunit